MSDVLHIVAYLAVASILVLSLARFAEWSVTFWERREREKRARYLGPPESWAYTPDYDADEPDPTSFDRHAEAAVRLVREWPA